MKPENIKDRHVTYEAIGAFSYQIQVHLLENS